jgi:ApaG protein
MACDNFFVMPVTSPFFYRITDGVRITVRPSHLPEKSRPETGQYVFSYAVRIENVGAIAIHLLSRRWHIHDSIGEEMVVEGEGVVGLQPRIAPAAVHEYESFCVLKSREGYMEGEYFFEREDGTTFAAQIPRFPLIAD